MSSMLMAGFFDNGFFHNLLVVAVAFCWGFSLYDLATRSMSGRKKAVWLVLILVLPLLGTVVYLMVQPIGAVAPRSLEDVTQVPGGATQGGVRDPRPQVPHPGV